MTALQGLSSRLDSMGQAVQRIQAADNGISTIRSFISAMKGVVNNALGNTDSDARADLGKQFNELINQIGTNHQTHIRALISFKTQVAMVNPRLFNLTKHLISQRSESKVSACKQLITHLQPETSQHLAQAM